MRAVTLIPGAGEFVYSRQPPSPARSAPPPTSRRTCTPCRAAPTGPSPSTSSQATLPNVGAVSLIVGWFGTDLRAGDCQIRPGVDADDKVTAPARLARRRPRRAATRTSSACIDGRAAYGGTPSEPDRHRRHPGPARAAASPSRSRPSCSWTCPPATRCPIPTRGAAQPAYPWRGRITVTPAAGQPGSPDKTAAAATQVAAFVGTADAVRLRHRRRDRRLFRPRRVVLPPLHPALRAPGRGRRRRRCLRHRQRDARPHAGARQRRHLSRSSPRSSTLAADVKAVLGPGTKVTYAADWSEYFGHQPADGSGDVYFHLDPLWSSPAIDAIGIDVYWPLADWRDGTDHLDRQAGASSIYDLAYLAANIAGGEGYDWYYASPADRDAQVRTPITDGGAGKPWVFRFKDIRSWWSNPHFDRPGGIESATPTAWVPQSKPFWFTELGCPAVDKGANQPNVFVDPKSSESQPALLLARQARRLHAAPLPAGLPRPPRSRRSPTTSPAPTPRPPSTTAAWSISTACTSTPGTRAPIRPSPPTPTPGATAPTGGSATGSPAASPAPRSPPRSPPSSPTTASPPTTPARSTASSPASSSTACCRRARPCSRSSSPSSSTRARAAARIVFAHRGAGASVATLDARRPRREAPRRRPSPPSRARRRPTCRPPPSSPTSPPAATIPPPWRKPAASPAAAAASPLADLPLVLEPEQAAAHRRDLAVRGLGRARARAIRAAAEPPRAGARRRRYPRHRRPLAPAAHHRDRRARRARHRGARHRPRRLRRHRAGRRAAAPAASAVIVGQPLVVFLDLPLLRGDEPPTPATSPPPRTPGPAPSPSTARRKPPASSSRRWSARRPSPASRSIRSGPAPPRASSAATPSASSLDQGSLASVTELALLGGANAAAIRNADGEWEVLQFASAVLTAPATYLLSGLLRGQAGTELAMRSPVAAGARFVLLDGAPVQVDMTPDEVGLAFNWRCGPASRDIGYAALPRRPARLHRRRPRSRSAPCTCAAPAPAGDLDLTWMRRTRIGGDSWDSVDVPLGEDSERYEIDILDGSDVVRTLSATSPAATYTAAQQTDRLRLPATLRLAAHLPAQHHPRPRHPPLRRAWLGQAQPTRPLQDLCESCTPTQLTPCMRDPAHRATRWLEPHVRSYVRSGPC